MALPVTIVAQNNDSLTRFSPLGNYYVEFSIAQRHYALPLAKVERILRMVAVTPVPEAPPWIAGLINLAGQALPVIDMRACLGAMQRPPRLEDCLLVLELVALWVDEVCEVREIAPHQVDALPEDLAAGRPIRAAIRSEQSLILLLDADGLISFSGQSALDWAIPEFLTTLDEICQPDDLTQIKGIGKAYALRLQEHGLHTFSDLARASQATLKAALGEIKGRSPDLHSWLIQAKEHNIR